MFSKFRTIFLLVLLMGGALPLQLVQAETYYVDQKNPIASDANPGSETQPWLSLYATKGIQLAPGDTVVVKPGVYTADSPAASQDAMIDPKSSGTPDMPITFIAQPRYKATLNGGDHMLAPVHIDGQSYIVIDGFRVERPGKAGIVIHAKADTPVRGIVIQNNIISGATNTYAATDTDAIRVENAIGILIRNNQLSNIHDGGLTANAAAIKCYNVESLTVENNDIVDSTTGIYVKNNASHVEIQRNNFRKVEFGVKLESIGHARLRAISIHENIFNQADISVQLEPEEGTKEGIELYNNVFANYTVAAVQITQPRISSTRIWNNIFERAGESGSFVADIITSDDPPASLDRLNFNLYTREPVILAGLFSSNRRLDSLAIWSAVSGLDKNSIVAPAGFQNPSKNDFRLSAGSFAINRGRHLGENSALTESIGAYLTNEKTIGFRGDTQVPQQTTEIVNKTAPVVVAKVPVQPPAKTVEPKPKPTSKTNVVTVPKSSNSAAQTAKPASKPSVAGVAMGAGIAVQTVKPSNAKQPGSTTTKSVEIAKVAPVQATTPSAQAKRLEWEVRHALETKGECVLESNKIDFFDGYDNTGLKFKVFDNGLYLLTKSNIDITFNDIGIQVGNNELLHADKVVELQGVLFKSKLPELLKQLQTSNNAKIQLRFWPSYPATTTYSKMVDLNGFQQAYDQYQACKRGK